MKAIDLHKFLKCDADTGKLFWLPRTPAMFTNSTRRPKQACSRWNTIYAGKEAMTASDQDGYRLGKINNVSYRAHRVVWAITNGDWPADQIDHINGDTSDNRPINLRSVKQPENGKNQKRSSSNKSGVTGVHWLSQSRMFRAAIKVNGKTKHLGLFPSIEEAAASRKSAEAKFGFHQNHGRGDA